MNEYENQIEFYPEKEAGNHKGWWWLKHDTGAWQGPSENWPHIRNAVLDHCPERKMIVTAGGCCGMYPFLWAKIFEVVYVAEPDPLNFYVLNRNCQQGNIVKLNAAFGALRIPSRVVPSPDNNNVGMHRIEYDTYGFIPTIRIDDLTLTYCNAISLDVEGAEAHVLQGAEQTIMKHRPVITVETANTGEVRNWFQKFGYVEKLKCGPDTLFMPKEK